MKLNISNFQSISSTEFEFKCGITLISGESNSGKTSLFRALNSLLLNPTKAKKFIKKGENSCKVRLIIDDNEYNWYKDDKEVIYRINNDLYEKAGRTNLFDLTNEELPFVKDINDKILNFHNENSVLFPYSYTSTEMFKLFEDIFAISDSNKILHTMKEDIDKCNKNIINSKKTIDLNNTKIEYIRKYLDNINIDKIENKYNKLLITEEKIKSIRKDLFLLYKLKNIDTIDINHKDFCLDMFDTYYKLKNDVSIINEICKNIKKLELEFKSLQIDKEEIERILMGIKICPLCGK